MNLLKRADRFLFRAIGRKDDYEYNNIEYLRRAKTEARARLKQGKDGKPAVLILCYSFYGGGAERVACTLGNALASDHRVILLCIENKARTYPLDPSVSLFVMPAFEGEAETVVDHWVVFTRWMKAAFRVKAAVSFMFAMNQVNVRSRWREKVICSERNNPAMREPEHMPAITRIYEQADLVVFQTERVRALFGEEIRDRSTVIPNPVTIELRWEGGSPRVVSVGRLTPQKNQALLLRAFARFHAAHPGYTLSVYGEGPLREMLTRLAVQLGISDAVFLEGNVPDLHRRIRDAEMFVLSSDYEGMSNALLECMAMGMPCISTACEGSDELIRSGVSGILTETGDEEALYRAMCRLAEDPALRQRLGDAAHRTARAYRAELIANRWRRLIDGDDGSG